MTSHRIPNRGRVDHARPVRFSFDGKAYHGLVGDTLASALLANGVHLMGRSFKYHRPRGVVSAGSDEPNALMGTRRGPGQFEPNTRATIQELREGLEATSQNRWPSLGFDVGAINDRMGSLFSAGFYYKTFMWPRAFWDRVYEPVIRNAAGLGVSPSEPDADRYAARFAHTDVLVVGAGPAGLAAALAAGRSGASVMLVDETAEPGGSLLSEPAVVIDGKSAWDWLAAALAELAAMPNVTVMTRTTAIGYYHQNLLGLCQRLTDHLATAPEGAPRERLWKVRAGQVVLAQGALEKPLVFDGNDRPGVMLAGAAQTYLNRYGVKVGDRPAIVTAHDSAWHAAFDLAEAGAKPAVIVDVRLEVDPALTDRARALGIETLLGRTVTGTTGRLRVKSLRVNRVENGAAGAARDIACDAVLMCGGWTPCLHLFSHTKGSLAWDEELKAFLPGKKSEAVHIAGAGRGLWGIAAALDRRRRRRRAGRARRRPRGRAAGLRRHRRPHRLRRHGQGAADRPQPCDRQGLHRLPERRHRQGHPARRPRGHALDRARQALHHQRHGDRPGQDVEHQRPDDRRRRARQAGAAGRPHHLPPALHADDLRNLRRLPPGRDVRRHPEDPDRPLGRGPWRRLRAGRPLAPRLVFPEGGRGHARRRRPRVPRHPRLARHLRRINLGQDRGRGAGRRHLHGADVHQPLGEARDRALPLRPAARRGRLHPRRRRHRPAGRRPLPRHHHHRRRGARPQHDGGLPADRVARPQGLAHLHHRAVGDRRPQRPERPQAARAVRRGPRHLGGAFPHMSVAECTVAGFPARLFRISFTGELGFEVNVPARHGRALWEKLMEPASSTTSAPTAPRPCTCCAPRRATSSSARTPTAR